MPFIRVDPGATVDIGAEIAGTVGLLKADAGTLVLSGTNSYTGGTVISSGTLQLGDGGTAGSIVGDVIDDGALVFNRSNTLSIDGVISGSGTVTQAGTGTTILTGDNTYTGGTVISDGTLQLGDGGAGGGIVGNIVDNGALIFDRSDALSINGVISGSGTVTQAGTGTTILTGVNTYTGVTTVQAGTLAVNGSIASPTSVDARGILGGNGTIFGDVANAGTVAPGNSIGTLTVVGNYVGNNGRLALETVLAGDHAPSDVLVIDGGSATGATTIVVSNAGGLGAQTVSDGIKVVNAVNGATTAASAFALAGQFVTASGQQAVIGGAYGYTLHRGGVSARTDVYGDTAFANDWYLRSELQGGPAPQPPYQPGVPVYEAYSQALLGQMEMPTLQQRVGNRYWSDAGNVMLEQGDGPGGVAEDAPSPDGSAAVEGNGSWARIVGSHGHFEPDVSTSGTQYDLDLWKLQAGFDGLLRENDAGDKLIGGITAQYGRASTDVFSVFGNGNIDTTGYGVGATMTWYQQNGFYVDGQAQATWFDSDLGSGTLGSLADGNDGFGYALSLEAGKRIPVKENWTVTPQAQLAYAAVDFDSFTGPSGELVSLSDGDSLLGRLGIALDREASWNDDGGRLRRTHFYGIANLHYEFLDGGTTTTVSGTGLLHQLDRLWGEAGLGGSYNWGDDKYSIYGEGSIKTSLADFGDSYALKGTAGFRIKW